MAAQPEGKLGVADGIEGGGGSAAEDDAYGSAIRPDGSVVLLDVMLDAAVCAARGFSCKTSPLPKELYKSCLTSLACVPSGRLYSVTRNAHRAVRVLSCNVRKPP